MDERTRNCLKSAAYEIRTLRRSNEILSAKAEVLDLLLVDVAGEIKAQTGMAIQFYDGTRSVWLPRSQVEINDDGTVTMPEWLALDKELI